MNLATTFKYLDSTMDYELDASRSCWITNSFRKNVRLYHFLSKTCLSRLVANYNVFKSSAYKIAYLFRNFTTRIKVTQQAIFL